MDAKGKINVGISSALIDLKAELLKKQSELRSSKAKAKQGVTKSVKKSNILQSKGPYVGKNKGVEQRGKRDLEEIKEEERTIDMAKAILEQKAKLYEKMTAEALDYDETEHPVLSRALVNFTQKAIDDVKDKNAAGTVQRPVEIDHQMDLEEDEGIDSSYKIEEEEWVEFIDGLGRTRRCLKTDLPSFLARDDELARPKNPGVSLSREAEQRWIEMKRQKWENDSQETAGKDNVHYQDVLYDEIRTHGVGFYNFSKDEETRKEQLKELKKLSAETEATRKKVLDQRSAEDSALQDRLKKIKAKKRAKLGLPPEEEKPYTPAEAETIKPVETVTNEEPEIGPSPALNKPHIEEEKEQPKTIRAWDFGKAGVFGPKPDTFDELDAKWLKDRRSDRPSEFAPPKFY